MTPIDYQQLEEDLIDTLTATYQKGVELHDQGVYDMAPYEALGMTSPDYFNNGKSMLGYSVLKSEDINDLSLEGLK